MNHIIKKQTLNIDMPPGYDTWSIQDSFKEVFNRDVLPRIERVCDELKMDKHVSLKLDKLTIDTGTISSQELTSTWAEEIENEFRKELLSHQQEKFDQEQVKSLTNSEQSEMEAFIHFLEKGVLPWWVSDEFKLTPEQLLKKLLSEHPKELVSQIARSKSKGSISKRLLYQFEPKQLKQLGKHFSEPETKEVLNSFQSICVKAFKTIPQSLKSAILATEIATSIDQNLIKSDKEKLFQFLFTHLQKQQSGSAKNSLSEIHKTLTDSSKTNQHLSSLEEQKVLSIALKAVSNLSGSQQEFKEKPVTSDDQIKTANNTDKTAAQTGSSHTEPGNSSDSGSELRTRPVIGKSELKEQSSEPNPTIGKHKNTSQKTQSIAENLNDASAGSSQANKESFDDQKQSERSSDKTNTSSPIDEPLSAQDKRAWEHIERIKKLQLAKLNQEKQDKENRGKKDAPNGQAADKGLETYREDPSPSQASESLSREENGTEAEHRVKHEMESNDSDSITQSESNREASQKTEDSPTTQTNHEAKTSKQIGQNTAKQNTTEPKVIASKQDNDKNVQLPEQSETQTDADLATQSNTTNRPGQEISDQTKSINSPEQTDEPLKDNAIASESLEKSLLIQGKDQSQTHQPPASGKQATSSTKKADGNTHDRQSDNPGQTDSLSPVKQVIRKLDKDTFAYWQEELESIDECYIQNAGLILFWPYLGHFFKDMGLTTDGAFQSDHDQKQAALLLQYLLSPYPELHEYRLPLNKLLCGLKISEPVGRSIDLAEEELAICNNLLEATIHNWSALRGTSVEGFQSSFLQRKGVLKRKDKHWLLQVEKMPFDMLMEQLPWPIGIVRLSWMNKPIYVEW